MAIQMRRGNYADLDTSRLVAGEFAVSQDNQRVFLCVSAGNVVEIMSNRPLDEWVEEAEAWAAGTKNGEPVESTDIQYHNNSKYYSEIAEEASLNPPYIGANGNWYVWDTTVNNYVDSGVDASITVTFADVTMLAPDAEPYITNTGTSTDPIFHLFVPRGLTGQNGQDGQDGTDGQDGYSPVVTVTDITGGHRVNITDKTHPSGQNFDVMDGAGAGDMRAAVYDPNGVVANAGGIANYAAALTDLASAFSDQTAYAIGDYVSYQGAIYRFVAAHSAGAWSSSDVLEVAVCSDLKNKVNADAADYVINSTSISGYDNGGLIKKTNGSIVALYMRLQQGNEGTPSGTQSTYRDIYCRYNTSTGTGANMFRTSPYRMKSTITLSTTSDVSVNFTRTTEFTSANANKLLFNVYTSIDGVNPKSRVLDTSTKTVTITFPPYTSAVSMDVVLEYDLLP